MEENFAETVLPIYPRMSRLVLARGLTTTAPRCARGLARASSSPAPALLYRRLAVWPCANKPAGPQMGFSYSQGWQRSSPVLED